MVVVLLLFSFAHAQADSAGRSSEPSERRKALEARLAELEGTYRPASYYSCLLDRHPGTMNDAVARRITQQCEYEHPRVKGEEPNLKRFQLFGRTTPEECFIRHAKGTGSEHAICSNPSGVSHLVLSK